MWKETEGFIIRLLPFPRPKTHATLGSTLIPLAAAIATVDLAVSSENPLGPYEGFKSPRLLNFSFLLKKPLVPFEVLRLRDCWTHVSLEMPLVLI